MTAGGQRPAQPPQRPGGGRGPAVLIGVLSFAVVFVLIVGGTLGVLLLRPDPAGEAAPGAASEPADAAEPARSPGPAAPAAPSDPAAPSAPATPPAEPAECWSPALPSFDSLPAEGELRGGGLRVELPETYAHPGVPLGMPYLDDVQASQAPVEEGWHSTMLIGAVSWQPGGEYPGAEAASRRIVQCLYQKDDMWTQVQDLSLGDLATEAVSVDGMDGYRTTAVVRFSADSLERTDATEITVVVLETAQGPGAFVTETALGVAEHERAAARAHEQLAAS